MIHNTASDLKERPSKPFLLLNRPDPSRSPPFFPGHLELVLMSRDRLCRCHLLAATHLHMFYWATKIFRVLVSWYPMILMIFCGIKAPQTCSKCSGFILLACHDLPSSRDSSSLMSVVNGRQPPHCDRPVSNITIFRFLHDFLTNGHSSLV